MKTSLYLAFLVVSTIGFTGCSPKPQEQVVVAQAPSAYDNYKQEIGGLSQKAITLVTFPNSRGGEPFVIAKQNPTYPSMTEELRTRIKNDTTVEGSETTGKKAELLAALQQESSLRAPMYLAQPINRKARDLVVGEFRTVGREALKNEGVRGVVLEFKGIEGLAALQGEDGADIERVLP